MFEFVTIGKILKPFRHNGEFMAVVMPEVFEDLKKCRAVFLKIDGLEVPFFLESLELDPEVSYIKLEEFNAPEDVRPFNGQNLFLRTIDLTDPGRLKPKKDPGELSGFSLEDITSGKGYPILRTAEYPSQWMAILNINDQEVLVPLVEEWIKDIDTEAKWIRMELPEGLIGQ
jgi:16S rRNA processing protein RimM